MKCKRHATNNRKYTSGMERRRGRNSPLDHVYAHQRREPIPADNNEANETPLERLNKSQNEIEFLKKILLTHLELIQHQSSEIVNREKKIEELKIENAQLKNKVKSIRRSVLLKNLVPPPLMNTAPQPAAARESSSSTQVNNSTDLLAPEVDDSYGTFVIDTDLRQTTGYFFSKSHEPMSAESTDVTARMCCDLCAISRPHSVPHNFSFQLGDRDTGDTRPDKSAKTSGSQQTIAGQDPVKGVAMDNTPSEPSTSEPATMALITMAKKPSLVNNNKPGAGKATAQIYKSRNNNKVKSSNTGNQVNCSVSMNPNPAIVHTYSKKKTTSKTSTSNHSKLIDVSPPDDDPYQMREDDMRELSPIQKLVLPKSGTPKKQLFGENVPTVPSKSEYDFNFGPKDEMPKIKLFKYNLGTNYVFPGENDDESSSDSYQCSDSANTEPSVVQEPIKATENKVEVSLHDFSRGGNSHNIASTYSAAKLDRPAYDPFLPQGQSKSIDVYDFSEDPVTETKKIYLKSSRSTGNEYLLEGSVARCSAYTKTTDHQSQSTNSTASSKTENIMTTVTAELPLVTVNEPYYTSVGMDDWSMAGVHPDLVPEGHGMPGLPSLSTSLEVPFWRINPMNSIYGLDGVENLHEEHFRKRHRKPEQGEKQMWRWDVQAQREQKRVEHLRRRQRADRDGRGVRQRSKNKKSMPGHSLQPQPHRQAQYIQLTDDVPLSAFGENMPPVHPKF